MFEHLAGLETELKNRGIKEAFRGKAWGESCREWVYFDCVLIIDKLRQRFNFPDYVKNHINEDNKSGMEVGFYCERCKDGIMGIHPSLGQKKIHIG
ncbi:MAG TPA: hypothetical protein VIH02_09985 [Flavobacterium sp.]